VRGRRYPRGQRLLAQTAGISLSELSAVLLGKRQPNPSTLAKLSLAIYRLQKVERDETEQTQNVLDRVRKHCEGSGLRRFARRAGVDPANLASVLKGRRKPGRLMLAKLQAFLAQVS
jgi:transcriptional regulator with XRE-family HTH domain